MLRRFMLVPLAALGVGTAFLVGGAGGAVTSVVRIQPAGVEPNGTLRDLAMTDDGECIVAESTATNDVATDNNGGASDIVLFQRSTNTWTRITNGNDDSFDPSISDDCNLIVFATDASDVTAGDTNGNRDVVVFNRGTSAFARLTTSARAPEVSGNGQFVVVLDEFSLRPLRLPITGGSPVQIAVGASSGDVAQQFSVSDDGNLVVFMSHSATLLGSGVDTNGDADIFLRNISAGTTELVSQASGGGLATGGFAGSILPDISGNGRYVAFEADSPAITGGSFGPVSIVRDLSTGTNVVLAGNDGFLDVNDQGVVALTTYEPLVAGDSGADPDAYLIDSTTLGVEWLSRAAGGGPPSGGFFPFVGGPLVSNDGGVAVFTSTRTNLIAGDTNNCEDGFIVVLSTSGGGSSTGSTSGSTSTATTSTTPFSFPLFTPPNVKLELTVEPAAPLQGGSYAPGELFAIELTVKNVGTDTAHGALINQQLTVRGADGRPVETTFPSPECAVIEIGDETTFICSAGNLAPGAERTFRVLVRVHGEAAVFTSTVARSEETVTESQSHELAVDDGSRSCAVGASCESTAGTTTTTCTGAGTACKYGGEGVMNTICRGEAVCGGGPERETHICSGGAVCKDKAGAPNVFRCSGEDTYCAGVGAFTCTGGAFCRVWGRGTTVTCTNGASLDLRGIGNSARLNGCDAEVGPGTTRVTGGVAADTVVVSGGSPSVTTGGGGDTVIVKGGTSTVRTGPGDDAVDTGNGERNVVDTGGGYDTVNRDSRDLVTNAEIDPRMDLAIVDYSTTASVYPKFGLDNGAVELLYDLYELGAAPEARIVVANLGPLSTPGFFRWELAVERADVLGFQGLSVVEADAEGGSCATQPASTTLRVDCTLGTLASGERRSILIRFTSSLGYMGRHGAFVNDKPDPPCSEESDRDCRNNWEQGPRFSFFSNRSSVPEHRVFEVPPASPDTSVALFGPERIRSEAFARYTVVVRNIGVITAEGVTASVVLFPNGRATPRGAVTVRTLDGGSCTVGSGPGSRRPANAVTDIDCTLPPIPVGERKRIEIEINGEELRSRRWRDRATTRPTGFLALLGLVGGDESGIGTLRTGSFTLRAEGRAADEYKLRENTKVFGTLIDP